MKNTKTKTHDKQPNSIIEASKIGLLIILMVVVYTIFHTILTLFIYAKGAVHSSFPKAYNAFGDLPESIKSRLSAGLSMGVGIGVIFGLPASIVATAWQGRLGSPLSWKELIKPVIRIFIAIFIVCVLASAISFLLHLAGIHIVKNTYIWYTLWCIAIPLSLYRIYDKRLKRA